MEIATIGFTKSSAEWFFGRLRGAGFPTLIDIRLNRSSQLAGFAKEADLGFFLREIAGLSYAVEPLLTPQAQDLAAYRGKAMTWREYEARYCSLLREREVEMLLDRSIFEAGAVLLCSEATPERCHRRLAAEYLAAAWAGTNITHL